MVLKRKRWLNYCQCGVKHHPINQSEEEDKNVKKLRSLTMTTTTKNAEGFYATACMSFWMVMAIGTQMTDDLRSFRLLLRVYHYTMILRADTACTSFGTFI